MHHIHVRDHHHIKIYHYYYCYYFDQFFQCRSSFTLLFYVDLNKILDPQKPQPMCLLLFILILCLSCLTFLLHLVTHCRLWCTCRSPCGFQERGLTRGLCLYRTGHKRPSPHSKSPSCQSGRSSIALQYHGSPGSILELLSWWERE